MTIHTLTRGATAALLLAALPLQGLAQQAAPAAQTPAATTPAPAPAFTLEPLPYRYDALEPVIDARTMQIHHDRHHRSYVGNLNKAIDADPSLRGLSLEAMMARVSKLPEAVRNHGGGHWNHDFFWKSMVAPTQSKPPSAELAAAIDRDFGSMAKFKETFQATGLARFGSGWVWLIVGADGKLKITSTPNQDNPLMDVAAVRGTPLLGNDVWEHAYYLKYQNLRGDYLFRWWDVVDWSVVSQRYAAATRAGR
jgi:Fe-Mn family superoxide dismutase